MIRNIKEKLNNAKSVLEAEEILSFDCIYFKSTRRKHESGYYIFEVYGEIDNEFYVLSKRSDVLDFWKINKYTISIDIVEPSIFRVFSHGRKIIIPYKSLSIMRINTEKENDE